MQQQSSPSPSPKYLAVLPHAHLVGEQHDFIRLPHPRTGTPSLYLPRIIENPSGVEEGEDEDKDETRTGLEKPSSSSSSSSLQILEVQKIRPDKSRSWFLDDEVLQDGGLLVFTPIDPLFLLIPILVSLLSPSVSSTNPPTTSSTPFVDRVSNTRYLPVDDLIYEASLSTSFGKLAKPFTAKAVKSDGRRGRYVDEDVDDDDDDERREESGVESVVNEDVLKLCNGVGIKDKLRGLCESQTIASEQYYRPSPSLILQQLRRKVDHLSSERIFDKFESLKKQLAREGLGDDVEEVQVGNVIVNEKDEKTAKSEERILIERQARIKLACEIVGQYLPSEVLLFLVTSYDFTALDEHISIQASIAFSSSATSRMDSMSEMESMEDSGGGGMMKVIPGTKRKAGGQGSRGVEMLKKVNTTKMMKLTSFFQKKVVEKK